MIALEIIFITMRDMARVPCSFSAQEEFLARIDARAAQLGMKRSEFIVHALRHELQSVGSMTVVAEQAGSRNKLTQNFSLASPVPAAKPLKYPKAGKTKKK